MSPYWSYSNLGLWNFYFFPFFICKRAFPRSLSDVLRCQTCVFASLPGGKWRLRAALCAQACGFLFICCCAAWLSPCLPCYCFSLIPFLSFSRSSVTCVSALLSDGPCLLNLSLPPTLCLYFSVEISPAISSSSVLLFSSVV